MSSFCICKSYSHFFSKNTCELDIVLTRTVNILSTNELVKLTTLWTTGPWSPYCERGKEGAVKEGAGCLLFFGSWLVCCLPWFVCFSSWCHCLWFVIVHYENTPIQINWNFTTKNWKFQIKILIFFSYFCSKQNVGTRLNRLGEAVLTSTHNLCFWAEIRKIMYTLVNPSFTI